MGSVDIPQGRTQRHNRSGSKAKPSNRARREGLNSVPRGVGQELLDRTEQALDTGATGILPSRNIRRIRARTPWMRRVRAHERRDHAACLKSLFVLAVELLR